MPTLRHHDRVIPMALGQTVLDALLAAGVKVGHSCRAGACQSCLVRAVEGSPPAESQRGLKESLKSRGFFMACSAAPETDLAILTADEAMPGVKAALAGVDALSASVVRVRLRPEGAFDHRAGQFLTLVRDDGLSRSYSIASVPARDPELELHVRRVPGGRMSRWLADEARPGMRLEIRGPAGDCFYMQGRPDQPLLLAGTGTGLAPLHGILQDALSQGHTGRIVLMHGAVDAAGLYLVDELRGLAARHPNVTYLRCLLRGDAGGEPGAGVEIGPLDQVVQRLHPSLKGWSVTLCGDPELVGKMRRQAYLAGADLLDIHADAFVMSPSPGTARA
jgi:ferredoxin-NADP reductase/ferredoxin